MKNITIEVDANGIALATIDMPGRPFNVFSEDMTDDLETLIETIDSSSFAGVVITSGKNAFVAGADLAMVKGYTSLRLRESPTAIRATFSRLTRIFRHLEGVRVPTVAAVNGLALGGGLELAMACHYRIAIESQTACLGLPEVLLGLLPAAGGTQRLPRLVGVGLGSRMLISGRPISPMDAHAAGLIDVLTSASELIAQAKKMIGVSTVGARWDRPDWVAAAAGELINGESIDKLMAHAGVDTRTAHLYPAVAAICRCVIGGYPLAIDAALEYEADQFLPLMLDPVAGNMVRTSFLSKTAAPKRAAQQLGGDGTVKRIAVLGSAKIPEKIARNFELVAGDETVDAVLALDGGEHAQSVIRICDVRRAPAPECAVALLTIGPLDRSEAVEIAADAGPLGARALAVASRMKLIPVAVAPNRPGPSERLRAVVLHWLDAHAHANLAAVANAVDLKPLFARLDVEVADAAGFSNEHRQAGLELLEQIALEAAACLDDELVAGAVDLDVLAVFGLGYPAWTGGPLSFLDMQRRGEINGLSVAQRPAYYAD